MTPQKCPHLSRRNLGTQPCSMLKWVRMADEIYFARKLTVKWGNDPVLSSWIQCNLIDPCKWRKEAEVCQDDANRRINQPLEALKVEGDHQPWVLRASGSWKRLDSGFPPSTSRKAWRPAETLAFAQGELFQTSDLQNCMIITLTFYQSLGIIFLQQQ